MRVVLILFAIVALLLIDYSWYKGRYSSLIAQTIQQGFKKVGY